MKTRIPIAIGILAIGLAAVGLLAVAGTGAVSAQEADCISTEGEQRHSDWEIDNPADGTDDCTWVDGEKGAQNQIGNNEAESCQEISVEGKAEGHPRGGTNENSRPDRTCGDRHPNR